MFNRVTTKVVNIQKYNEFFNETFTEICYFTKAEGAQIPLHVFNPGTI